MVFASGLAFLSLANAGSQDGFLQQSSSAPHQRARNIRKQMTLEEKVALTHGNKSADGCSDGYVGCVPGLARLGVPPVRLADGPQGFRGNAQPGTSTQWPSGMTVGMAWDPSLMGLWGEAMGKEFFDKGANVLFGPAVNLHRVPTNGRNFEYLSGEDPYLGRILVQPIVQGIQSQGVIANVKHYIDNNQEGQNSAGEDGAGDRHSTSSNVDERTQVEMYFGPYEGAIDAGVLSVMCGNNLVNGEHICENNFEQNVLLREWFGFEGFVCSDYRGSQTTRGAALGGLDMQLPGCDKADPSDPTGLACKGQKQRPNVFGQPLADAVRSGDVPYGVLNDKVDRTLFALISVGALGRNSTGDIAANVTSEEHSQLAHRLAVESAVLLKNDGLLPLDRARAPKIAVIGAAGHDSPITGGGGSGSVVGPYRVSILEGLRRQLGDEAVTYYGGNMSMLAYEAALAADVAVVVLADTSKEGLDRDTLHLPDAALVEVVASAQPKTLVVTAAPGPFLAPWADAAQAVLAVWMSGQEQGAAVADLVLGVASPSGKLSLTIPNTDNEVGLTADQYPGTEFHGECTLGFKKCYNATYSERLEVGYRWYNAHNVAPKFPFGHGLTYSEFQLSDLAIEGRSVSATLENTGEVDAAEVVQLYISFPESAGEPPKQLRGFRKLLVKAGAHHRITFDELSDRELSIWDADTHAWSLVSGAFDIHVGFSSADLSLSGSLNLELQI